MRQPNAAMGTRYIFLCDTKPTQRHHMLYQHGTFSRERFVMHRHHARVQKRMRLSNDCYAHIKFSARESHEACVPHINIGESHWDISMRSAHALFAIANLWKQQRRCVKQLGREIFLAHEMSLMRRTLRHAHSLVEPNWCYVSLCSPWHTISSMYTQELRDFGSNPVGFLSYKDVKDLIVWSFRFKNIQMEKNRCVPWLWGRTNNQHTHHYIPTSPFLVHTKYDVVIRHHTPSFQHVGIIC